MIQLRFCNPDLDLDLVLLLFLIFLSILLLFLSFKIIAEEKFSIEVRLCIQGILSNARSKVIAFLAPLGVLVLSSNGPASSPELNAFPVLHNKDG